MKKFICDEEKKYIRAVNKLVLLLSVFVPFFTALIIGGIELILVYFSSVHGSGIGYIAAQLISIVKDCINYLSFLTAICIMGSLIMSFDGRSPLFSFFIVMLNAPVSLLTSFAVDYILIAVGWHDMSMSGFFSNLQINLLLSGITVLVYLLLDVCAYALFRLSKPMKVLRMREESNYKKAVRTVFICAVVIKVAFFIIDSVSTGISFSSINGVMSTLIVPLLSDALDVGASYFVFVMLSARLSDLCDKLGIGSRPSAFFTKKKKRIS